MNIKIEKRQIKGDLQAPPSKSAAHRLMIAAALAAGRSVIRGVKKSEDMLATLDCIAALGAAYTLDGDVLTVEGVGEALKKSAPVCEKAENGEPVCGKVKETVKKGEPVCKKTESGAPVCEEGCEKIRVFPCRESGSTLRFFIPVSLLLGERVRFEGTPRLFERGIGVYEELFREKGITVEKTATSVTLTGRLTAGTYTLCGNVSSQFITGLLLALPLLEGESVVEVLPPVESRGYIDMTLDTLAAFGVEVKEVASNTFLVKGGGYLPRDIEAEGDWSNGAALLALRALGHDIRVSGLNAESLQGDRVCLALFDKLNAPVPPAALIPKRAEGICAAASTDSETPPKIKTETERDARDAHPLRASAEAMRTAPPEIDLSNCPDLAPVMFAVAAARGGAVFTGTRRLRIKESDRAAVMAMELLKFGVCVEVEENRVIVHGGTLTAPTVPCDAHNDHRVVMALTLLGLLVGCELRGAEAINKSFPDFFKVLGLSPCGAL